MRRLSASAIETWDLCKAKWGFRYLDGIADTGSAATALGTRVHSVLEKYLTGGGIDFRGAEGYIAQPGLRYLPEPKTEGMELERSLLLQTDKALWSGFIDVILWPGASPWPVWARPDAPVVMDHKTTSAEKWAKTPETLATNNQAVLYAKWTLDNSHLSCYEKPPGVSLRWVYYQTKGARKSHPVDLYLTKDEIEEKYGALEKKALQLYAETANLKSGNELPKNSDACSAFGGCPYKGVCKLSTREKLGSIMALKFSDFMGKPSGNADHAPKPPAAENFAETPAPAEYLTDPLTGAKVDADTFRRVYGWVGDGTGLFGKDVHGRVVSDLQGLPLPPAVVVTQRFEHPDRPGEMHWIRPCTATVAELLGRVAKTHQSADPQLAINPPEFQPQPDDEGPALTDHFATDATAPILHAPTEGVQAVEPVEAGELVAHRKDGVAPAEKKRGRPRKTPEPATIAPAAPAVDFLAVTKEPHAAPAVDPASAEWVPPPEPETPEYQQGAQGGPSEPLRGTLVVYSGCYPRKAKNAPVDISAYVARAHAEIEIDHWRLVEYGKGAGLLTIAVREALEKDLSEKKTVAVYLPKCAESEVLYATLYAMADLFVSVD